jgi:hypothetical protein
MWGSPDIHYTTWETTLLYLHSFHLQVNLSQRPLQQNYTGEDGVRFLIGWIYPAYKLLLKDLFGVVFSVHLRKQL